MIENKQKSVNDHFRAITGSRNNSCLHYIANEWDVYACGYLQAAASLVQQINDTKQDRDTMVFPICFLYRHYLELRFKNIIRTSSKLMRVPQRQNLGHNIESLWCEVRNALVNIWPEADTDTLAVVDKCVADFVVIDSSSQSFRYPVDLKGKRTLSDLSHINTVNLYNGMQSVSDILDGVALGIEAYLDNQSNEV